MTQLAPKVIIYCPGFFRICRGITPDLGVRACVRTLSPPNPDIFTAIPKDPKIISGHALNVVDLKAKMVFIIISVVLIFRGLFAYKHLPQQTDRQIR